MVSMVPENTMDERNSNVSASMNP